VPNNLANTGTTVNTKYLAAGVIAWENSTSKAVYCELVVQATNAAAAAAFAYVEGGRLTAPASGTGLVDFIAQPQGAGMFLRLRVASGTIFCEFSYDRATWYTVTSFAVTTAFTTAPTHYGINLGETGSVAPIGEFRHLILG
jgi:hypothetical protein